MAAANLLALIDDIATLLDDMAVLSKVAAKKTAGVLGDDLALNAQQITGVSAERELPVVWTVAKGSMLNKVNGPRAPAAIGRRAGTRGRDGPSGCRSRSCSPDQPGGARSDWVAGP